VLQVGSVRRRGGCRLNAARQTTVRIGGLTGKSEWPLPGRRESSLEQTRAAGEGRFEPTNRRPANGRNQRYPAVGSSDLKGRNPPISAVRCSCREGHIPEPANGGTDRSQCALGRVFPYRSQRRGVQFVRRQNRRRLHRQPRAVTRHIVRRSGRAYPFSSEIADTLSLLVSMHALSTRLPGDLVIVTTLAPTNVRSPRYYSYS
jgi:hypothetical protein